MKTRKFSINDVLFLLITLSLALIVYWVDMRSTENLSFAPLYSLIILFSWLIPYALTIFTTAVSSGLLLLTLIVQLRNGYSETSVIIQGFIAYVVIIVTFVLTRITSNSSSELRKNNIVLNGNSRTKNESVKSKNW